LSDSTTVIPTPSSRAPACELASREGGERENDKEFTMLLLILEVVDHR